MSSQGELIYCSQNGEDILLSEALDGQTKGYYVELGGHDGVHLSNTYYFEKLGWSGLIVEAHSRLFGSLEANRSDSVCVHAAVAEEDGETTFYETPLGSLSTFDPQLRDYFIKRRSEVTAKSFRETRVRTARTTTLLDEVGAPRTIDFMSVDIEGAELAALKSLNFDKYYVRILMVEFDRKLREEGLLVEQFLKSKGYQLVRVIGVNAFWVKEPELASKLRDTAFAGEVTHILSTPEKVERSTRRVSFAAGENSRKRSFVTRIKQSVAKRYRKYLSRAA